MNGKDMLEWMNNLDDKAVTDADMTPVKVKKNNGWKIGLSIAAGVLVLAVLAYVLYPYITGKKKASPDKTQVTEISASDDPSVIETKILKSYEMASPNYPSGLSIKPAGEKMEAYEAYYKDIVRTVLFDTKGENKVFSPLCMYMSLSMAAEITGGNSRQQILDVLHQPDIESSRASAKTIWMSNYLNSNKAKLLLANSFWTNSAWTYEQRLLNTLALEYFASSYSGDPKDPEYSEAFRAWIHDQTDGLLDDFSGDAELDPSMVLAMVSSVNFSGTWTEPFSYEEAGIFHGTSGDVTTAFVKSLADVRAYSGDHFVCASVKLTNNGSVRFILPEEGMTPEQLLQDDGLFEFMNDADPEWDDVGRSETDPDYKAYPELVMPKVDITTNIDFKDYLRGMGITDVFDVSAADLTPLTQEGRGELTITSIEHDARVIIDENGCKAIAVSIIQAGAGDRLSDNQIVLDRPYIFEIVSETGLPIFVGIVNNV